MDKEAQKIDSLEQYEHVRMPQTGQKTGDQDPGNAVASTGGESASEAHDPQSIRGMEKKDPEKNASVTSITFFTSLDTGMARTSGAV